MNLEDHIQIIILWVSYSYTSYMENKLILKVLSISHNYLVLSIIINWSDLNSLFILVFIGILLSSVTNEIVFKNMQNHIIVRNFIAIIIFFHISYITNIDHFITSKRYDDLLRPISYYYSIKEINSYCILHLHYMLCLIGNIGPVDIRS